MSSSVIHKNSSFKKITNTYKNNMCKSKASCLLLTEFNKFPIMHCKAKTTKKKKNINHQTYSNNSMKIKYKNLENDNNNITNNFNKFYDHIGKNIGFNLINNNSNTTKGIHKDINENNAGRDMKCLDILDNNIPKRSNESVKCNSVNNLIGININVNYMNKNYSINKLNHKSNKSHCGNNYNIYNYNSKIVNNNNKKNNMINNNSFNEINSGNLPNSSSSKTNPSKKNIFILNPINQDWEKVIDNLKSKKRNKSKNNLDDNIKSEKLIQNFIGNNRINISTDDINISSKANNIIESSSSCKNINYVKTRKDKKSLDSNKFIHLYQNMIKKINQLLTKKENNYEYNYKLLKIIKEYFIEYNQEIDDQYQKKFILEIFHQMNTIIKTKEEQIINLQKENEKIKKLNKDLNSQNEELIKNINLNNNNDISEKKEEGSDISSLESNSSSVNTEELESIRFFDKIFMKKNSFSNIPGLSFKKLYESKNDKNIIMPQNKNNKNKRYSFQKSKNKNQENKNNKNIIKYQENKKSNINKNDKNNGNSQLHFNKRKINDKNERNKPNIKSFINIFEKSRNKK